MNAQWYRARFILPLLGLLLCAPFQSAYALVSIERGLQVNGIWVFPLYNDPSQYVYLPTRARLVNDLEGDPKFSLTFFVSDEPTDDQNDNLESIREADGGAIIHFLVTYDAFEEQLVSAEIELQEMLNDEDVSIVAPIVFDSGRYTVISSVLNEDEEIPATLQTGSAPVLSGNQLALSFRLSPENAAILLGTFQTDTPDLSIAFELDFSGLTEAYQARMIVDWTKTQKSLGASLGGNVYIVSAEAKTAIDRLVNEQAVRLEVDGDDAAMETLLQHVYDKTLELLFAPIDAAEFPENEPGLMQALGQAVGGLLGDEALNGSPLPFSVSAAFERKDLRSEGESVLSFHKRARVSHRSLVTANLGDLYARYHDDPSRFKVVRIGGDPIFQQRHIHVGLDGALVPEFNSFIDAIQVTVRKKHPDGTQTVRELRLTREQVAAEKMFGPLVYGNAAGEDIESWRTFEYQTSWSFRGGARYVSPWRTSTAATLILTAPYHRQVVILDGDLDKLKSSGVRALSVRVNNDFFGFDQASTRTVRAGQTDQPEPIQLVLPDGEYAYNYRILWVMNSGDRLSLCDQDDFGIIFLDDLQGASSTDTCPN